MHHLKAFRESSVNTGNNVTTTVTVVVVAMGTRIRFSSFVELGWTESLASNPRNHHCFQNC